MNGINIFDNLDLTIFVLLIPPIVSALLGHYIEEWWKNRKSQSKETKQWD